VQLSVYIRVARRPPLVYIAACLIFASCDSHKLGPRDLVGVYNAAVSSTGRPHAHFFNSTLTLSMDGRFTFINNQPDESILLPPNAYLHSGSGLWILRQPEEHVYLDYKISQSHFSNPVLTVRHSGSLLLLYLTIGDPDTGEGLEYVIER
jgi:hypothetical protein